MEVDVAGSTESKWGKGLKSRVRVKKRGGKGAALNVHLGRRKRGGFGSLTRTKCRQNRLQTTTDGHYCASKGGGKGKTPV